MAALAVAGAFAAPASASAAACPGADPCPYEDLIGFAKPHRSILIPVATAVDPSGNVYIADFTRRIVVRAADGTYLRTIALPADDFAALDLEHTGTNLFALGTSGRVHRFSTLDVLEASWGTSGEAEGQFADPRGIAVAGGSVYVAEATNHRVQVFDENGTFQRMWGFGVDDGSAALQTCTSGCQAGLASSGDGGFTDANDVAVNGEDVYVVDATASRVQRFSTAGAFELKFGSSGSAESQFGYVPRLAIAGGKVFVGDGTHRRIQRFSSEGVFERMWGHGVDDGANEFQVCTSGCQAGIAGTQPGQIAGLTHVAASAGKVYLSDVGGDPLVSRVERLSTDGVFEFRHADRITSENILGSAAASGSGSMFLSGVLFDTIERYMPDGTPQSTIGGPGTAGGAFSDVWGLGLSNETIFASDAGSHRIQRLSLGGAFERTWGRGVQDGSGVFQVCSANCQSGSEGTADGELTNPGRLATDGGKVFVLDSHRRVTRYSADGAFERTWGFAVKDGSDVFQICTSGCQPGSYGFAAGQLANPTGIAAAGGKVYVADSVGRRISRYDDDGDFERAWGWGVVDGSDALQVCTTVCQQGLGGSGDGRFSFPIDIAVTDRVFVVDLANNRVEIFSIDGAYLGGWGEPGPAPGQLELPLSIGASSTDVVVTNLWGGAQRFCLAGPCIPEEPVDGPPPDVPSVPAPPGLPAAVSDIPLPQPLAGSARLASRSARVRRGRAEMRLRCAPPPLGECAGTVTLFLEQRRARRSQRTRKVRIGRAAYRIPAGHTRTVRVRLSRSAQARLRRRRSLTVRAELLPRGQRRPAVSRLVLRRTR